MKFSVNSKEIANVIAAALKGFNKKATSEILSYARITANETENNVEISCYDFNYSTCACLLTFEANVEELGNCLIKINDLLNIVKSNNSFCFEYSDNLITINAESGSYKFESPFSMLMDYPCYNLLKDFNITNSIPLNKKQVSNTLNFVDKYNFNIAMQVVSIETNNIGSYLVASDGYKLSHILLSKDIKSETKKESLVHHVTFSKLKEFKTVIINTLENETFDVEFVSKGDKYKYSLFVKSYNIQYLNYNNVVPSMFTDEFVVDSSTIEKALKQCVTGKTNHNIRLSLKKNKLTLYSHDSVTNIDSNIDIKISGVYNGDNVICFNKDYLEKIIKCFKNELIKVQYVDPYHVVCFTKFDIDYDKFVLDSSSEWIALMTVAL